MGDQAKHPIIIGLTGNIGSGKSTVAAFLREMGYPVLDADLLSERARELKKAELKALFPEAFLGEELDRRRLAQLVFSDPQKLRALEELIHPEVRRLLEEELSRLEAPLVFVEIPLLFEKGWEGRLQGTILVAAPLEERLKRAMARSGLSREEVLARERAQMPEEEKRRRATWVLENRGSLEDLRAQVQALLGEIRAILGA
ncbi:dephospho-CoA kinase [Thermus sp.]|jgi:dephospho-CoA kinase|uniref:dephospho-CoA kinase n=1 Tax=Thermus sp. TaxID=275 RepID=UPI0028CBF4DB|nr:dephospho-CoA kinase [Thermus sp.]MDT7909473.1 dephospho-CoA kinase [Thermus sp.]MDT7922115.1 dephospho-CoA kinase [Thermus sp.]